MRVMFGVGIGLIAGVVCGSAGFHPVSTSIAILGFALTTTAISFKIWP